jgi:hypothetical protein
MSKKIIAIVAALFFLSLTSLGIAQQQVKSTTLKNPTPCGSSGSLPR